MKKLKRVLLSVPCFLCTLVILFSTLCFPVSAVSPGNFTSRSFDSSVSSEEALSQAFIDFREFVCTEYCPVSDYIIYSRPDFDSLYKFDFFNGPAIPYLSNDGTPTGQFYSNNVGFFSCSYKVLRVDSSSGFSFTFNFVSGGYLSDYTPTGYNAFTFESNYSVLYSSIDLPVFDLKKNYLMVQDLPQRMYKETNNQLQQQTFPAVGTIVMIAVGCLALVVIFLLLLPKVLKKFGIR